MRLKLSHAPYIANKVSLDLSKSSHIEIVETLDLINELVLNLLKEDIQKELAIDERVREILEEQSTEIEVFSMNERELFRMCKKQVANEQNFPLNWDERCSYLAHNILNLLIQEDCIDFGVSDIIVKNVIYKSINDYAKIYKNAENSVMDKIKNYKRKLVYGSYEYEIVFNKLYEEELKSRGIL